MTSSAAALPRTLTRFVTVATATLALFALAVTTPRAYAQDLEPRAYANTPIGMNFVLLGYAYSEGGVATDPSVPLTNADIQVHQAFLGYARSLDLWGLSGKFAAVLPYAWLSGTADFMGQLREREVSGFGDPKLQLSVNFYGAPALPLKEFADYKQDLIIGASLQVSVPLGQYDSDKLVNIGTNRWFVKPEVGISKAWGPLILELIAGVTFYTDNDDFFGGQTREQDPLYSVQGHVIYSLPFGIWAALDGTYYTGGRTTVDGVRGDDRQENAWARPSRSRSIGTTRSKSTRAPAPPPAREPTSPPSASPGNFAGAGGCRDPPAQGRPARIRREKSGAWSAAWAAALM